MKFKYDPEADVLLITLSNKKPDFGEQKENIITHYDKDGKPIEIEILDASRTTVQMIQVMLAKRKIPKSVKVAI
ncbi:MAG: hypothetical protein DRP97_01780 [Candidatus Latescibacterota bacterium]|nr:MAG: hypothetical protein DRP97_01780 [Candidatus Latescibacterota bacterium]